MSLKTALAAAFVTTSLAAAPVSSVWAFPVVGDASFEAPVVANGSYVYDPTGTPWTYSRSAGISANNGPFYAGSAPDGVQAAFLQSNANNGMGSVSQTVTGLTIGFGYNVSFFLASRPGPFGSTPVDVTFGGVDLGSYTNTGTGFVAETSAAYVATATSAVLTFTATNIVGNDNDVALDAVSLTETALAVAVPEPASLTLLGLGAVGILAGRRRRAG